MREVKEAIKQDKAVIGYQKTIKQLFSSKPKTIVLASDCPQDKRESIKYYSRLSDVAVQEISENSLELGSFCGKPFKVSVTGLL
ncbi:ribosomal L7Ae/L30e/S12e/Gadd45 family protein [Candidatus Altiarchaeota archaeon]